MARQLVKHQVGLVWNEVSRHYIDTPPELYWPEGLNSKADHVKQGSTGIAHVDSAFYTLKNKALLLDVLDAYTAAIRDGIAPEDARMFLPLNMYTEWVWSGTLAAWARVCKLRLDPHAQVHTRVFAEGIAAVASAHFPVSFAALLESSHK